MNEMRNLMDYLTFCDDGKTIESCNERVSGDIIIPDGVESISTGAFSDLAITSVVIPDSVRNIGDSAFEGCKSLRSVVIPDSVKYIDDEAFEGSGLTSITIPKGVEKIGRYCFLDCYELQNIDVAPENQHYKSVDGVVYSKDGTVLLMYPHGRKDPKYAIPNSVKIISENVFDRNKYLEEIVIPSNVTCIGGEAFALSGLKAVTICEGVSEISDNAFQGCSNLSSVTLSNSVKCIGEGAFAGCKSLKSIVIPDSVKCIGEGAFDNSGLTSITIPKGVEEIGNCCFAFCSELQDIDVVVENQHYQSIGGVVYSKDGTGLLMYPWARKDKTFQIPDNVKFIGDYAFAFNEYLEEIIIPSNVTSIGEKAFAFSGLKAVTICEGVSEISDRAFFFCIRLTSVNLPDSVVHVGKEVFYNCPITK